MKKIILMALAATTVLFAGCALDQKSTNLCEENGGTWLAEYQECEYIPQDVCESAGGVFAECESACRNEESEDGAPIPCTMQCVQVCKFNAAEPAPAEPAAHVSSPATATYLIEGKPVVAGDSGAATTQVETRIWSADTWGDIDGDGTEDVVVILTRSSGGSGIFYYVAVALNFEEGFTGTNAFLLGDRIAPQATEIRAGEIIVNYADRYPWEAFAARPSVGKSRYLFLENGELKVRELPTLSAAVARDLVVAERGDCAPDQCDSLAVNVLDGVDGVWYVEAIYSGLRDDSVRNQKIITTVHFVDGDFVLGSEVLKMQKCQPGRGQQDFSEELCL